MNVPQMSALTRVKTYKRSSVSKPAQLKVNTPVRCASLIRRFGRRRSVRFILEKNNLLLLEEKKRGTYLFCRDGVCAWLSSSFKFEAEQIMYAAEVASEGRRRPGLDRR